jgi:hypothetical protein
MYDHIKGQGLASRSNRANTGTGAGPVAQFWNSNTMAVCSRYLAVYTTLLCPLNPPKEYAVTLPNNHRKRNARPLTDHIFQTENEPDRQDNPKKYYLSTPIPHHDFIPHT